MNANLHLNQRVARKDGLQGAVIAAGPYGDEPFQIRDEQGQHHPFINEDGSATYRADAWQPASLR